MHTYDILLPFPTTLPNRFLTFLIPSNPNLSLVFTFLSCSSLAFFFSHSLPLFLFLPWTSTEEVVDSWSGVVRSVLPDKREE